MKHKLAIIMTLTLVIALLAGCAGTPVVYYGGCTCPTGGQPTPPNSPEPTNPPADGAVKTGLAVITSVKDSVNANQINFDVTLVAVTVDDKGVIDSCIIDSINPKVFIDATGAITDNTDLNADLLTKNELGDNYGMVQYGGAKYEWYQQAAALADYAEGKTVEQLKTGAIDETGKAPAGSDLASTATIYLGGYVSAIEVAVNNAKHLGAMAGDELRMAAMPSIASSSGATLSKAGTAQLDMDVTALTVKEGVITSCYLDSLQASVNFDYNGEISTSINDPIKTKNELGEEYGMVLYGGAKYEWNVQAANFAAYVTGKTAAQVAGIAVSEGKPSDADLSSGVTIAIGGFQALIAKAMK